MNYKDFNDYELLDQIYSCSEDANEILLYKYRPLIVNEATKYIKYSKGGLDLNDFVQEGLLGLNDAINTFRNEREANFGTYARLCIRRRMTNLIKTTMLNKNKILNDYVPIDADEDEQVDRYVADTKVDPIKVLEDFDFEDRLLRKAHDVLTTNEREVFDLKLNGFNYKEIASITGKDIKVIDNSIQRIKVKLKKVIEEL